MASAASDLDVGGFYDAWAAAMRRVGADPLDAARVAFAETGMYQRHPRNPKAGIFPLIESTLHRLGWTGTAEEWTELSPVEQIPWVERYLRPYAAYLKDEGLIYVATFLPAHLARAAATGDSYVLTREGEAYYDSNRILDRDGDGEITVGDLRRHLDIQDVGARWNAIKACLESLGAGAAKAKPILVLAGLGLLGWGVWQVWKDKR